MCREGGKHCHAAGLVLGSDRALFRPQEGAVEEHPLTPLWQHVSSDGTWVCLALRQVLEPHRQRPTPFSHSAQALVRESNKMGICSFSWWVLGENKFWLLRSTRESLLWGESQEAHPRRGESWAPFHKWSQSCPEMGRERKCAPGGGAASVWIWGHAWQNGDHLVIPPVGPGGGLEGGEKLAFSATWVGTIKTAVI